MTGSARYFITRSGTDTGWHVRRRGEAGPDLTLCRVLDSDHRSRDWSQAWAESLCDALALLVLEPDSAPEKDPRQMDLIDQAGGDSSASAPVDGRCYKPRVMG